MQPHRQHVQASQGNSIRLNWTKDITRADQCVWRCLFEDLNQPTSSRDISHEDDDDLYGKVKQKMINCAEAIKSQHTTEAIDHRLNNDGADNWQSAIVKAKARKESSRKRKMEPSKKSSKVECTTDRFLDVLTYEQDVCNFKKIFEEIQIIQLDRTHCDNCTDSTNLDFKFDFDLYSPRHSFKQSDPGPPDFRILILKSDREPPTRELIVKAFLKPVVPTSVLVFYINELMRVSAFLYRISL